MSGGGGGGGGEGGSGGRREGGEAGRGEIAVADNNAVGQSRLRTGFGHFFEITYPRDRVDEADQGLQVKLAAERPVGREGLQYRARIGKPRSLDEDALEAWYRAAGTVGEEFAQGLLQVAAHIAA